MKRTLKYFGSREELREKIIDTLLTEDFFIISSAFDNLVELRDVADSDYYRLLDELGANVYGEEDVTLERTFVDFLIANNLTVAVAESCTGGMLSSKIVDVPNASKVFYEGVVTYSNNAKMERLMVNSKTLESHGAVSSETAKEMAYGLLCENVDLAISTTGIAGPDGGTDEKPVGLVYIGLAYKGCEPISIECHFQGKRNEIRQSATNTALFCAYDYLNNNL